MLLGLCAAALTMLGTSQALFIARYSFGNGAGQRVTFTGWTYQVDTQGGVGTPTVRHAAINGVPLSFAVLTLVAAAFGMLVARRRSAAGLGRASRLTAVIGATFLVATVSVVGVQEPLWLDVFRSDGPQSNGSSSGTQVSPGFWSLVTGAVLAVASAVVVWRAGQQPAPRRVEPGHAGAGDPCGRAQAARPTTAGSRQVVVAVVVPDGLARDDQVMTASWAGRDRRWLVVPGCLVAAALAVIGAFLPLFVSTVRLGYPNSVLTVIVNGWGIRATANGLPDTAPDIAVAVNGLPIVLSAVLLLLGTVRRWMAVAGAAFLAGTVLTVCLQERTWPQVFRPTGINLTVPNMTIIMGAGSGFYVLIAAVAVAVVAAALAARPAPIEVREEPETPPIGVPVVHRLPDEPPAQR